MLCMYYAQQNNCISLLISDFKIDLFYHISDSGMCSKEVILRHLSCLSHLAKCHPLLHVHLLISIAELGWFLYKEVAIKANLKQTPLSQHIKLVSNSHKPKVSPLQLASLYIRITINYNTIRTPQRLDAHIKGVTFYITSHNDAISLGLKQMTFTSVHFSP